jgi:hypothetical protein
VGQSDFNYQFLDFYYRKGVKSQGCFYLFTTYLTMLTFHNRVGVNSYIIFKSWGKILKLKNEK